MGGVAKIIKKNPKIFKKVEPVQQKSIEQPKVKSQMDNTDVKSDLINADKISLDNKRKGRKSTVLTSVTGVDAYPTLNKKTLLG
jgi:hypothetical protein